jgi:hypothetical protein
MEKLSLMEMNNVRKSIGRAVCKNSEDSTETQVEIEIAFALQDLLDESISSHSSKLT